MPESPDYMLVLHPVDPTYAPESLTVIVDALREVRLLGDPYPRGRDEAYLVGEDFLELVVFLGCSPTVQLEPVDDGRFCHVRVSEPAVRPRFYSGAATPSPRCPACRARIESWREAVAAWEADPDGGGQPCPACGEATPVPQLRWRHGAGFGRVFVEIPGVHPHEAVPADRLLDALEAATGVRWHYFYTGQ
jgi:hypothetical protein